MPITTPSLTLVFDLGGVLIDWNARYLYRRFFDGSPADMEAFLAEVCTPDWNALMDSGYPFAQAVAERVAQFPQHAELIRAFDTCWEETVAGPIQPTVDVLQRLKQTQYPLYALSNWSAEKFRLVRPRYAFLDWFDRIFISGNLGVNKPDPRIYQLFLEETHREPHDCLFIDDSLPNIRTASQLGFQTIHYQSPTQLESDLHVLGILESQQIER